MTDFGIFDFVIQLVEILTSDNVGDGDEAHMGEILELDVLEALQKTSDRDSRVGVERPVMNHVLPNT